MFTIPVTKDGSQSISAVSSVSFLYTDSITLTPKYFDGKDIALKADVQCYANTALSSDSGQLFVFPVIAETSGGTYTPFITGSGTSLIITGGTSVTGLAANGSYFIPLTIVTGSGVTAQLKSAPYIKFGYRAFQNIRPWQATLCIG